jgi:sugar phosphate isomerase/epimerase
MLSISSYSLREQLGPISIAFTDADGNEQTYAQEFPKLLDITDVPARAAQTYPVTGVEAVAFQFAGLDDPALDTFAARAREAGLELVNVAVDVGDLAQTDPDRLAADVTELKRWIARVADLGFRNVRVNAGSPFSAQLDEVPPAHLVAALTELGGFASERGIRLLVENHGGPSSDPAWMSDLLDRVGVANLGLLLDLGNFDALLAPLMAALFAEPGTAPADPFAELDLTTLYDQIDALAGRAELVHVKAHHVDSAGAVGPIDLPRALGILSRHGYSGPLTIEYEGTGGDPWAHTGRVIDVTSAAVATH